jgi:hypothetical protein
VERRWFTATELIAWALGVSIVAVVDVVWLFLSVVDLCQDSATGTDAWCRAGSKTNFLTAVALMGFVLALPLISRLGRRKGILWLGLLVSVALAVLNIVFSYKAAGA